VDSLGGPVTGQLVEAMGFPLTRCIVAAAGPELTAKLVDAMGPQLTGRFGGWAEKGAQGKGCPRPLCAPQNRGSAQSRPLQASCFTLAPTDRLTRPPHAAAIVHELQIPATGDLVRTFGGPFTGNLVLAFGPCLTAAVVDALGHEFTGAQAGWGLGALRGLNCLV
jgi:hypothetical protein